MKSRLNYFAISLGVLSILSSFIIIYLAYMSSIRNAEQELYRYYTDKAHFINALIELNEDKSKDELLKLIEHSFERTNRPEDEYVCIVDQSSNLILHTKHPETTGNYAGANVLDGQEKCSLKDLVIAKKNYIGSYISSSGEKQIAAFEYVPSQNWTVGVHRSSKELLEEIKSQYNWFIIVFIVIGGFLIPLSLGLLFFAAKVSHKNRLKQELKNQEQLKIRNIQLKEAIEEAAENEKKYRNTVIDLKKAQSVAGIGSWKWYIKENTLEWSDQMYRIFGISKSEFSGNLSDVIERSIHPDDVEKVKASNESAAKKSKPIPLEYRLIMPDKSVKTVWAEAGEIIYDEKMEPQILSGIVQDITVRKRTELLIAERNEEILIQNEEYRRINEELAIEREKAEESDRLKTQFINNMSHEIRTPMNGILGFSNLLSKPTLSESKKEYYIKIIQNSGNQLLRIIDDILEISILGTKQVTVNEEEFCLNDLLLELFSIFDIKAKENKTPLYLKKGLSDKASNIKSDKSKILKILGNLIENALKFTNSGFIEFGYSLIKDAEPKQMIEIYVKDTGIGIRPEKQELIFERFSQEEKENPGNIGGLGLGLSIAKENAELLGGNISLKSEKGKGATFFVNIPYKQVNTSSHNVSLKEIARELQEKFVVLVAEDEEVNYLFIETLLEDEINLKCEIIHAKNGAEAVEICKQNTNIDLVLMDIKMPLMNGYEALELIKEFCPDLPIIAQTAYSSASDKEKALLAGFDDFISKPIILEELREIINKCMAHK